MLNPVLNINADYIVVSDYHESWGSRRTFKFCTLGDSEEFEIQIWSHDRRPLPNIIGCDEELSKGDIEVKSWESVL